MQKSSEQVSYADFVRALAKPGEEILRTLTPGDCHLLHMAVGVAGEGGELLDAVKKAAIYRKALDVRNVIEELGDLEFFMEGIRGALGITREEVIEANRAKLSDRYKKLTYSDEAAQAREDKIQEALSVFRKEDKFREAVERNVLAEGIEVPGWGVTPKFSKEEEAKIREEFRTGEGNPEAVGEDLLTCPVCGGSFLSCPHTYEEAIQARKARDVRTIEGAGAKETEAYLLASQREGTSGAPKCLVCGKSWFTCTHPHSALPQEFLDECDRAAGAIPATGETPPPLNSEEARGEAYSGEPELCRKPLGQLSCIREKGHEGPCVD